MKFWVRISATFLLLSFAKTFSKDNATHVIKVLENVTTVDYRDDLVQEMVKIYRIMIQHYGPKDSLPEERKRLLPTYDRIEFQRKNLTKSDNHEANSQERQTQNLTQPNSLHAKVPQESFVESPASRQHSKPTEESGVAKDSLKGTEEKAEIPKGTYSESGSNMNVNGEPVESNDPRIILKGSSTGDTVEIGDDGFRSADTNADGAKYVPQIDSEMVDEINNENKYLDSKSAVTETNKHAIRGHSSMPNKGIATPQANINSNKDNIMMSNGKKRFIGFSNGNNNLKLNANHHDKDDNNVKLYLFPKKHVADRDTGSEKKANSEDEEESVKDFADSNENEFRPESSIQRGNKENEHVNSKLNSHHKTGKKVKSAILKNKNTPSEKVGFDKVKSSKLPHMNHVKANDNKNTARKVQKPFQKSISRNAPSNDEKINTKEEKEFSENKPMKEETMNHAISILSSPTKSNATEKHYRLLLTSLKSLLQRMGKDYSPKFQQIGGETHNVSAHKREETMYYRGNEPSSINDDSDNKLHQFINYAKTHPYVSAAMLATCVAVLLVISISVYLITKRFDSSKKSASDDKTLPSHRPSRLDMSKKSDISSNGDVVTNHIAELGLDVSKSSFTQSSETSDPSRAAYGSRREVNAEKASQKLYKLRRKLDLKSSTRKMNTDESVDESVEDAMSSAMIARGTSSFPESLLKRSKNPSDPQPTADALRRSLSLSNRNDLREMRKMLKAQTVESNGTRKFNKSHKDVSNWNSVKNLLGSEMTLHRPNKSSRSDDAIEATAKKLDAVRASAEDAAKKNRSVHFESIGHEDDLLLLSSHDENSSVDQSSGVTVLEATAAKSEEIPEKTRLAKRKSSDVLSVTSSTNSLEKAVDKSVQFAERENQTSAPMPISEMVERNRYL